MQAACSAAWLTTHSFCLVLGILGKVQDLHCHALVLELYTQADASLQYKIGHVCCPGSPNCCSLRPPGRDSTVRSHGGSSEAQKVRQRARGALVGKGPHALLVAERWRNRRPS
jgi:hypothetical protein